MLEENMARFVGMYGEIEFHKLGLEAADAALRGRGFCLFNRRLLDDPRDTPTDELERATMRRPEAMAVPGAGGGEGKEAGGEGEDDAGGRISYSYLYAVNAAQCLERARAARAARIAELRGAVAAYDAEGPEATVRRVWGAELDALDAVVKEAAADPRGWRFKESSAAF
jgi:hypothetical protein